MTTIRPLAAGAVYLLLDLLQHCATVLSRPGAVGGRWDGQASPRENISGASLFSPQEVTLSRDRVRLAAAGRPHRRLAAGFEGGVWARALCLGPFVFRGTIQRVSVDFQVVFPQEVIPLVAIRQVPGMTPRTLDITGSDFRSLDEVLLNEIPAPGAIIVSQTRLLVPVPSVLSQATITSVSVLSRRLTLTPRSVIQFRVGRTPSKVRGILRLVQLFLKILFTTPGRDIFTPKMGAAALKNIGRSFGKGQSDNIVMDFVLSVETTVRQILAVQSKDASTPFDERLLSARLLGANFDFEQSALVVSVELTSQAGQAAVTNVVV